MTRIDAMSKLSVEMSIDGVKDSIALINEIYDHFENVEVMFPESSDDWGTVEGVILPDLEISMDKTEEVDTGAINDYNMKMLMIAQLQEDYGYSMLDAEAWVRNHGECVVSDMWDAYSDYMNKNVDYS